jgi:hypothetical protein
MICILEVTEDWAVLWVEKDTLRSAVAKMSPKERYSAS